MDFHKEVSGQVLGGDVWVCFLPRGDESGQVDKSFRLFREDTKTRRWFRDTDDKGFHAPGTHVAQLRSIVAVTRYLDREGDRGKLSDEDLAAKYSDPKKQPAERPKKASTDKVKSKSLERSKSASTERSKSLPAERPAPPAPPPKAAEGTPVDKQLLRRMRWGWPTAEAIAANKVTSGVPGRRKPGSEHCPDDAVAYAFVLVRGAPEGTPPPAVTSPTGWVMCIPGAVLRFNDERLMMLAEAWESAEGVATVSGRMVLTRRQLRETYHLEKGAVRKMPGWQEDGDLTFATEEAAETRQLFLTETVTQRRLDDLYVSPDGVPGACLVQARDARKPPSRGSLTCAP